MPREPQPASFRRAGNLQELPGTSFQLSRQQQPAMTSATTCSKSSAVEGRTTPALPIHALEAKKLNDSSVKPQRTLKWRRRTFTNVHPRKRLPIENIACASRGQCVCNQSNTWRSHHCSAVGKMATESLPRREDATCESWGAHVTKLLRQDESIKTSTR